MNVTRGFLQRLAAYVPGTGDRAKFAFTNPWLLLCFFLPHRIPRNGALTYIPLRLLIDLDPASVTIFTAPLQSVDECIDRVYDMRLLVVTDAVLADVLTSRILGRTLGSNMCASNKSGNWTTAFDTGSCSSLRLDTNCLPDYRTKNRPGACLRCILHRRSITDSAPTISLYNYPLHLASLGRVLTNSVFADGRARLLLPAILPNFRVLAPSLLSISLPAMAIFAALAFSLSGFRIFGRYLRNSAGSLHAF